MPQMLEIPLPPEGNSAEVRASTTEDVIVCGAAGGNYDARLRVR